MPKIPVLYRPKKKLQLSSLVLVGRYCKQSKLNDLSGVWHSPLFLPGRIRGSDMEGGQVTTLCYSYHLLQERCSVLSRYHEGIMRHSFPNVM